MPTLANTWKRARQPDQIEERRSAILMAAAALFETHGLEGTGINAVAREAGISKANIYRYFESREAILLRLLLEEHRRWMHPLARRLRKLQGCKDIHEIAQAFSATLAKRAHYCLLIGSLGNVLEHHVSSPTIRAFKRELQELTLPILIALNATHPKLSLKQAQRFVAMFVMSASGTWPHCHPALAVKKILAEQEFAQLSFSFQSTMQINAVALLRELISPLQTRK